MDLGALLDDSCSYDEWQISAVYMIIANTSFIIEICSHSLTFAQYVPLSDHFTPLTFQGYVGVRVVCMICMHLTPYIWFPIGV